MAGDKAVAPGMTFASAFDPWKPRPWMSPFGAAAMPSAAGPMPQSGARSAGPSVVASTPQKPGALGGPAAPAPLGAPPKPTVMPSGAPGAPIQYGAAVGRLPVPRNPDGSVNKNPGDKPIAASSTGKATATKARPFNQRG